MRNAASGHHHRAAQRAATIEVSSTRTNHSISQGNLSIHTEDHLSVSLQEPSRRANTDRKQDISARSPVILPDQKPRISLDSRTFQQPAQRNSSSFHRPLQVPGTQKEEANENAEVDKMEDVSLEDPKPQPQKKRGMFSRIMPDSSSDTHHDRPASADGTKWHHFGGRKRGQSGQGSELGSIPTVKREETPKPESQLRKEVTKPTEGQAAPGAETSQAPRGNAKVDTAVVR